jgi:hypothetical protein
VHSGTAVDVWRVFTAEQGGAHDAEVIASELSLQDCFGH